MGRMSKPKRDDWWDALKNEVKICAKNEPSLAVFYLLNIMAHESFGEALAYILAGKLAEVDPSTKLTRDDLFPMFHHCFAAHPELENHARLDLMAIVDRDPAVTNARQPLLYFKGFHALQTHRLAHVFWNEKRRDFALFLQSQSSSRFQVDIHPAATLGHGIMMDHATGIVIGETATVGNDVSMLHGVTLGGTGKEGEDRHPKIGDGVLLGANATILGNFKIGHCSRVAAGSVVLMPVPPNVTVAGIPARIVGKAGCSKPATAMDQLMPGTPKKPAGKKSKKVVAKK